MKKIFLLVLMVIFVLSVQGFSFAKSKELSFAVHFGPKNEILNEVLKPWAAELEKRTSGDVKVKFYVGQTLAKTADEYDAVVDNIADLSWNLHGFNKGRFPLISVMELPFLSPSTEVGAQAFNELYGMFPEMQKEHADVHPIYLWATLPYQLHTIKKPVKTLEDLKGMKLACTPGVAKTVQALGAVPVPLPPPKMYETLEKGVADGVMLAWAAFKVWKLQEVTQYHTKVDLGSVTTWCAMNNNTWNKLTDEQQKIINEISKDLPMQTANTVSKHRDIALAKFKEEGHEFFELTPDEKARWIEKTSGIKGEWIKQMEGKGLPGKKVVEAAEKLIEKYSK
jgi:TRAP-type C4-dicarboxylate transport system substrate-binding protein